MGIRVQESGVQSLGVFPLVFLQAVPNWFVRVTAIKEQLIANNNKTYWVPAYVKEKRFHNWLEVRSCPFKA